MYVYFPAKNDLIVAVLEFYRANYERSLSDLLARNDLSSREKIVAIFEDAARNWFANSQFHGCLAVNAMGEFAGKSIVGTHAVLSPLYTSPFGPKTPSFRQGLPESRSHGGQTRRRASV